MASKIIVVCEKIFWGNKCFHMFSHTMVSYLVNGSSVSLINEFDWKYQWQFLLSYWIITRRLFIYIVQSKYVWIIIYFCYISVAPVVKTDPPNGQLIVMEGETASLGCHISRGSPKPEIIWRRRVRLIWFKISFYVQIGFEID